jgi:Tfp pilus assembly protein PilX
MRQKQKGMALIVGLILLLLITLVTVTSFNLGKNSLEVVGNMQNRDEAVAAANRAIQEALSSTNLFNNPAAILTSNCSPATPNTRCIDTNNDGTTDITVSIGTTAGTRPTCVQSRTLLNADFASEVVSTDPVIQQEALNCLTEDTKNKGIQNVPFGSSLCSFSVWEIVAVATDAVTQTTVTVTEGAAVRAPAATVATFCP